MLPAGGADNSGGDSAHTVWNLMVWIDRLTFLLQGVSLMFFICAACFLLLSGERSRRRAILGYVVLFFAFDELKDVLRLFPAVEESEYALALLFTMDMWTVGACASYLMELVSPRWLTARRAAAMVVPFVAFSLVYAVAGSRILLYADLSYVILFCVGMVARLSLSVSRYDRFIRDNYSNLEHIDLKWLLLVTTVWLLCLIVWVCFYIYGNILLMAVYYLTSISGWTILIVCSDRLIDVSVDDSASGNADAAAPAAGAQLPELRERLSETMNREKLYLDSGLTLNDLAAALCTNRTYLSSLLNRELNMSFYDYVNSFRISYACRMLESNPALTVQEAAEKCGFNSISTFRRAFVRTTGKPFAEYRKAISIKTSNRTK